MILFIIFAAINGEWTVWGDYGSCSKTCGGDDGTKTRTRTCDNPAPSNGGTECEGSGTEDATCGDTQECPGNHLL